jgi:hypothetical protein
MATFMSPLERKTGNTSPPRGGTNLNCKFSLLSNQEGEHFVNSMDGHIGIGKHPATVYTLIIADENHVIS